MYELYFSKQELVIFAVSKFWWYVALVPGFNCCYFFAMVANAKLLSVFT